MLHIHASVITIFYSKVYFNAIYLQYVLFWSVGLVLVTEELLLMVHYCVYTTATHQNQIHDGFDHPSFEDVPLVTLSKPLFMA